MTKTTEFIIRAATTVATLGALALVLVTSSDYQWNWETAWDYRGLYLDGLQGTITVSLVALIVGLGVGIFAGLGRLSRRVVPNQIAKLYVDFVRGTPLLVQIFLAYYCIAVRATNKLMVGGIVLGIFAGAYIAEIVRAGIESIDRGQIEAARALGLNHRQSMRQVVLPQAIRRIIPPMTGQFVSLIKDSSLLLMIGYYELMKAAREGMAATYKYWEFLLPVAVLYLLLTLPLTRLSEYLERRLNPTRKSIHV